jgi:hypothetical protein
MADSPQEIQKQVKKILLIGAILIFFTVVTVALSYVELPSHSLNIIVGMILATIKAALVALVFIYKVLAFTGAFVLALFLLFYFSNIDPLVFKDF